MNERTRPILCVVTMALGLACDDSATTLIVENGYDNASVYRVWYGATLVTEPVAPEGESAPLRAAPGSSIAYALVAPGWRPDSGSPPPRLIVLQSRSEVDASRSTVVRLRVDDRLFDGDCASRQPLSQQDADAITQRVFPGQFMGTTYDAATCTTKLDSASGGAGGAAQ